jgi:uncharacterized alpha-E superfamily protein
LLWALGFSMEPRGDASIRISALSGGGQPASVAPAPLPSIHGVTLDLTDYDPGRFHDEMLLGSGAPRPHDTHTGRVDPEKVAELLILDPRHPRSIRFNVAALEAGQHAIRGAAPETYGNEAERLVGRLNDTLKYDRIADVFARGLHPFLEDMQRTCEEIGDQVARTYFCCAAAS